MRKSKILISLILIITILSISLESLAKSFDLKVIFDGKNITMESETTDMSWNLDNFLPGNSDTSSITITNGGEKTATVETSISIEEDTGLLEMIDLTVTNKAGETVYTGKYTELETITKSLKAGESETYTAVTSLNVNAGNEYQNKQYKLKFSFKAIGEIPYGTLTVKYVDENGEDLEPATVETKKITSDPYSLPQTGKNFEGYRFEKVEGPLSGEYKEEGITVTYYYNKIKYGKLTVKHIDEEGNVLKQTEDTKETGTKYSLEATGKLFEGYKFVSVEGNTEGEYVEGETLVTYKYSKIKYGQLIVQHIDKANNNILAQTSETREVGTPYELSPDGEYFPGYKFVSTEGELTGNYKEEDTIVKYMYEYEGFPKPQTGTLTIKYLDENDNEIQTSELKTGEVGTSYIVDTIGKNIPGYRFVSIEGESSGVYTNEGIIVIYRYKKIENGRVIILYVDENENKLEEIITPGIVDDPYEFTREEVIKNIPGYEFKTIEGDLTGQYEKEDIIIFCRYEKIKYGRLIVVYIDENNEVLEQIITTERVGTNYNLGEVGKEIEGYTFLGIEGEPVGKYKEEDTIVTYRYRKNKPEGPTTEEVTLPKTGQYKYVYIVLGTIILSLGGSVVLLKRRKMKIAKINKEKDK